MFKPAFSTVACPEWTLKQVAERAIANGFEAVELRTFGDASTRLACDPSLTSDNKVRSMFMERGVEVLCLGTSVAFDAPIFPPVMGVFCQSAERSIREGKRAVDLAVRLECPYVRVFGFEYQAREPRPAALKRIGDRLSAVLDHADKSGVRIVIENGGSFPTSAELCELMDRVQHPLLGVSYSLATGHAAGEPPESAVGALGDRLWVARIKDARAGRPAFLGEGEVPCSRFAAALVQSEFDGPLVFEWDRAWIPGLAPAEDAIRTAAVAMYSWLGGKTSSGTPGEMSGAVRVASGIRR